MSGGGGGGVDPFGSRPDEILQHVLSFLPSREAVHASQLSRRWRNLWRSTPAIRILPRPSHLIKEDYYFLLFVNGLLLHRDASAPLRSFQIETSLAPPNRHDSDSDDGDGDGYYELEHGEFDRYEGRTLFNLDPHVDLWIAHALSACRARELTVRFGEEDANVVWEPRNPLPFASRHLTALHLDGVRLYDDALLDFTPCAALRDLSLTRCRLAGDKAPFVSPSLERLSILSCHMDLDVESCRRLTEQPAVTERTVCTPRLRYLQISDDREYREQCRKINNLEVPTPPSSLEWWTPDAQTILPRDLTWCPVLSKLTLENNEWCKYDASGPASILWQTPLLKGLILQLLCPTLKPKADLSYIRLEESVLEMEGRYDEKERIIKCRKVDARVDEIVKLLSDRGISLGETIITNKQS